MDDRKQRIMMAIVSLYGTDGEPVGSNLLSRYFDMAVSSATLRNEMAALTRLGLLEQPHTSAGRVPTAKGYRYYVDNLLNPGHALLPADRAKIDAIFNGLDYDPDKMVQGAARSLAQMMHYAVIATNPRAQDMSIAHFKIIRVGRSTAALLAVTAAGGVRTRVAKVDFELSEIDAAMVENALNTHLRFVAQADVDTVRVRALVDSLGRQGPRFWPLFSAALTILSEVGKSEVYFEGQQHLLHWPELEQNIRTLMELTSESEKLEAILEPKEGHTAILFGDEFAHTQVPGLCLLTRQYLAGGGLSGVIAVAGPLRMPYREVIPKLEYFSELLGQGMSGAMAG